MHAKVQTLDRSQPFPWIQLGTLEPIALASILPYANKMVESFDFCDRHQAPFYSGILVSSFAIAEAAVCPLWGALSDRIGRKPVLLIGMVGTMISILMMGFASNFWFALVARSLGGLLNGNIGVIQTIVGEICKNPEHEPRAFSLMPIVWLLGTIIGPTIAALCVNKVWPELPFLLPNLICTLILAIAVVAGWVLLKETHPDFAEKGDVADVLEVSIPNSPSEEDGPHGSYGTFAANISEETLTGHLDETSSLLNKMRSHDVAPAHHHGDENCHDSGVAFTKRVIMLITALGLFCYHSMCFDHLLPILLTDSRPGPNAPHHALPTGGLGISLENVGLVMAGNGVIALIVQIILFPPMCAKFGVFRLFQFSVLLHPLVYVIPPFITALPTNPAWAVYASLVTELVIRNMATIVLYPLILILLKEATPRPSVLGRINGVAASCGSVQRALAPPIVGFFYGLGEKHGIAGLAWWTTAIFSLLACGQLLFIRRVKKVIVDECGVAHDVGKDETEEYGFGKHGSEEVLIAEVDSD